MPKTKIIFTREEILAAAEALFKERNPTWTFNYVTDGFYVQMAEIALKAVERLNE